MAEPDGLQGQAAQAGSCRIVSCNAGSSHTLAVLSKLLSTVPEASSKLASLDLMNVISSKKSQKPMLVRSFSACYNTFLPYIQHLQSCRAMTCAPGRLYYSIGNQYFKYSCSIN